ncbi:hypothetical protein HPHPA11_1524 [Helicobacter pylori Hp A-11]|uniref:Uncharacterized protein n=1 Tax=Helicobacter pylori Hp A-11 TaxID=992035 RepID=N4TUQ2_HELPX|nr:hypothetical protein HPHPA11_1524 [Helicobacter pylori Hp A-11]
MAFFSNFAPKNPLPKGEKATKPIFSFSKKPKISFSGSRHYKEYSLCNALKGQI